MENPLHLEYGMNQTFQKLILSGISMLANYYQLQKEGGLSSLIGSPTTSQFMQFSHWHCFEHFIPIAKHEQYFLLHFVFLHVQNLRSLSSRLSIPFLSCSITSDLQRESILFLQSSHLQREVHTPLFWKHLQYDFRHWVFLQLQNYPLSAISNAFFIWMQVQQHESFMQIQVLARQQGHSSPRHVGQQSQVCPWVLPSLEALLSQSIQCNLLLLSTELRFHGSLLLFQYEFSSSMQSMPSDLRSLSTLMTLLQF